jgi:hypothetical protein
MHLLPLRVTGQLYIAPVDCLTAPEMHLVAFSEKPLCLTDVLTATMRADGVSTGLGTDDNGGRLWNFARYQLQEIPRLPQGKKYSK